MLIGFTNGRVLVHTPQHGLRPSTNRKAVVADDSGEDLGIFATGYEIHQYQEWLPETRVPQLMRVLGYVWP